jgi:Flp pilus assembly protein TadG
MKVFMNTRASVPLPNLHRANHGQALVLVAVIIAIIAGMAAVAVDGGSYSAERRDLQNAADAIALAASRELPSASAAQSAADTWAVKNGVDPDSMSVTIVPQGIGEPNPKVVVEIERDHPFTFARLVGITSAAVGADATAIRTSAAGGDGMVPLSVTDEALIGMGLGDPVVLKYDANDITQGNTAPIRIDGSGSGNCESSDNYCRGVTYGSENVVCAEGIDPTYCSGPSVVDTQTGNVVGGTRTAIESRIDATDTHCDAFDEVFEDDPTSSDPGTYHIVTACNPFLEGGYESHRVLIIPVIDQLCNGSCNVTILSFALFFLEGFGNANENGNGNGNGNNNQGCTGNDCEVIGRFVRVNQNVGLLAGTFDPQSFNTFVRLVQ